MTATAVPAALADHLVPLSGDWGLWRDFAVRSAGFPVSGLKLFGPGDESVRLRGVARDPMFREAVTWQNPAAVDNAVLKLAEGSSAKPSRTRQREEMVASYWQRYCAKNDTIGFFGPLAWGRIDDEGRRSGGALGGSSRRPRRALRGMGRGGPRADDRPVAVVPEPPAGDRAAPPARAAQGTHGLRQLARLEAARAAVSQAPSRRGALAALARIRRVLLRS